MVNSFFISLEYISLLEASALNGNKAATHYKLTSKTRKLLGEKKGILRCIKPVGEKQDLVDEICKVMYENLLTFTRAVESMGLTYHGVNKNLSEKQRVQISETRDKFKVSYKTKKKWYA